MDVYDLERTDMILEILWLQAHNPEINQKTREVKMTRCLPLYGRNTKLKEEKRVKKEKSIATLEKENIVCILTFHGYKTITNSYIVLT